MSGTCYVCDQPLPEGQSFYEDHGVQVCLACYRTTPRCLKCKFPSNQLQTHPRYGSICEFCWEKYPLQEGEPCYLCQKPIPEGTSFYSDYDCKVCRECFQHAKRCFLCRFPNIVKEIQGIGGVCEFCEEKTITKHTDLSSYLTPLKQFLQRFGYSSLEIPPVQWVPWSLLLGMQIEEKPHIKIEFMDDLIHFCYPILYLKGRLYVVAGIDPATFMAYLAGQLIAYDLCTKYQLPHLLEIAPFTNFARGWCHWVSWQTAKTLKYERLTKILRTWPESSLRGNFPQLEAKSEYHKPKEVIHYAQNTLKHYAKRYL